MSRPHVTIRNNGNGESDVVIGFALKVFGGVIVSLLTASVVGLVGVAISHYALKEQLAVRVERSDKELDQMRQGARDAQAAAESRDRAIERLADLLHRHETAPGIHGSREP